MLRKHLSQGNSSLSDRESGQRRLRPSLAIVLSLLFLSPVFGQSFTDIVVFGDSLSDPGNHFVEFGTSSHQPFAPIPDASYDIGGHHFSNGATWIERVATALKMPTNGDPAFRSPGIFTNYAVGRARSRACSSVLAACPDGQYPFSVVDLNFETTRFMTDFAGAAPPNDLYVMWIGANDLDDALTALQTDPTGATSTAILTAAIKSEATSLQALYLAGARTFLVPNAVNFAYAPFVQALGPPATILSAQFAQASDAGMAQVMSAMSALPGIRFISFDGNALFAAIEANPAAYGITNATEPCLSFSVIGHAICSNPNKHLFWDGLHPTTAGHQQIASAVLQLLSQ